MAYLVEFGHDLHGPTSHRPANPEPAQRYYNTDLGRYEFYNGSSWQGCDEAGASGASGSVNRVIKTATVTDNTATTIATVTVPNAINGGMIEVDATGMLGDGDATESAKYLISFSRIAGANAKATAGTKFGTATITGATANATLTITVSSVSGAVGASNTFTIKATVARSAGSADNHKVVADIKLLNVAASGITIA